MSEKGKELHGELIRWCFGYSEITRKPIEIFDSCVKWFEDLGITEDTSYSYYANKILSKKN